MTEPRRDEIEVLLDAWVGTEIGPYEDSKKLISGLNGNDWFSASIMRPEYAETFDCLRLWAIYDGYVIRVWG